MQLRAHQHQPTMGINHLRFCLLLETMPFFILCKHHHGHTQHHTFASPAVFSSHNGSPDKFSGSHILSILAPSETGHSDSFLTPYPDWYRPPMHVLASFGMIVF